jgi:hypothetical protein
MAIVVLVLWLFTAGAGFSLLASSNLSRTRGQAAFPAAQPAADAESAPASVAVSAVQNTSAAQAAQAAQVAQVAPAAQAPSSPAQATPTPAQPAARRPSRASRDRFAPPSLVAARNAPVLPGPRSLLEFAHPACALIGLGFWLGYTFVHYRPLGWIAFGLVTATICLGLSWFATNTRAPRRRLKNEHQSEHQAEHQSEHQAEPRPSFSTRLVALHGGAAAMTFALAALTALVLGR